MVYAISMSMLFLMSSAILYNSNMYILRHLVYYYASYELDKLGISCMLPPVRSFPG